MRIKITIGNNTIKARLNDCKAAQEFYEMISEGLTLSLSEYGGFEKVGSLGRRLSGSDRQITAKPGDIILYNSSELSLFYGNNSWSYTKLGEIDDEYKNNLASIYGDGDITVEFSI